MVGNIRNTGNRGAGAPVDDPVASAERTALMVGLVITMGLILVLVIFCVMLFISNKQERDVNAILKQKIIKRMIQCE